jgi:hypothetical protein
MRSTLAMTLAGFGTVLLSFGAVVVVIGLLGLRFNSREAMGGAGLIGLGFIVAGALLAGGGYAVERSKRQTGRSGS